MLRITTSASTEAAANYFKESLSKGDYYLEGQEIAGQWRGKGAEMLGLEGEIQRDEFLALIHNRRPDGSRLTARDSHNRRPGYDFTFDVPKSVSVLYAMSEDQRLVEAMQTASNETMLEIEKEMHARVRKNGAFHDRETGNMIWADFVHTTSRPAPEMNGLSKGMPDPHLHVHVYALNATFDKEEGLWKAGEFSRIKRDAPYWQALYHTRLAGELQKLGYTIHPTDKAFEIEGVADKTLKTFSRRTAQIEKIAKEKGITNDKAKAALGALTREKKDKQYTWKELRKRWDRALSWSERDALGVVRNQARVREGQKPIVDKAQARDSVDFALQHELERCSEVSERRLLATALQHGIGRTDVKSMDKALALNGDVLRAELDSEVRLTTKEVLAEERELLHMIRSTRGTKPELVYDEVTYSDPLFQDGKHDTKQQKQAIEHVLKSSDWVVGIAGRAGTGKTTLMKEVKTNLRANGTGMIVCAPTAEASRGVLRKEGFGSAETVKRLLQDKNVQGELKGSVLWIDEAGLLGTQDTLALLKLAKEKHVAKVVLAGDAKQIRSVARGDAFRFLESHAGLSVARLNKVQRQKNPQLKQAVEAISEGDAEKGFKLLEKHQGLVEIPEAEERHAALAAAYNDATWKPHPKARENKVLVIAPTHTEGNAITKQIRQELLRNGRLGAKGKLVKRLVNTNWTEAQRSELHRYDSNMTVQFTKSTAGFKRGEKAEIVSTTLRKGKVMVAKEDGRYVFLPLKQADAFQVYRNEQLELRAGDTIRMTANGKAKDRSYRLNNGDLHKVSGFTAEGDIRLGNGRVIPKDHGHLSHGYAVTADSAQAKTVDVMFASMSDVSMGATDQRRFYVALSRAKHRAVVYTDDKAALMQAAQRDDPRRTAHELMLEGKRLHARRISQGIVMDGVVGRVREGVQKKLERMRTQRAERVMSMEMEYGR